MNRDNPRRRFPIFASFGEAKESIAAIATDERAECSGTRPQSVVARQGRRLRNELPGLGARPRFTRAVRTIAEQCSVNVDIAATRTIPVDEKIFHARQNNPPGSSCDQAAGAAMPRRRRARPTCIGNHRPPFAAAMPRVEIGCDRTARRAAGRERSMCGRKAWACWAAFARLILACL